MIVTVTPNPSLDLLYEADGLVFDDANRLDEPRRRPGGQGINAARAVQRLGGRAIAVALLGGGSGREIAETLVAEGTSLVEVRAKMPTRLFVAVHDRSDGRNLLLNERGPARDADEADGLFAAVMDATRAHAPAWVAGCGSLPPGFPDDWYARLAHAAREAGAKVAIDCDGRALRLAAEYCDLLVPNRYEAGRLLGIESPASIDEAADAALAMLALGPSLAAVTLGPEGAVIAERGAVWHAQAPEVAGVAVGAGDAFLAGLVLAHSNGRVIEECLRAAVAAASGALAASGQEILAPAVAASVAHRLESRCVRA